MPEVAERSSVRTRTTAQLTKAFLGRAFNHAELDAWLADIQLPTSETRGRELWVGSVGYELFKDVQAFATHLRTKGVERLIDVRELPISRRRGYAKTALAAAMEEQGIEYLHLKGLGNTKQFRDLYKSGDTDAGRKGYSSLLLNERMDHLNELVGYLREKRSVLMCVEDDQNICHRDVILAALESELDIQLDVRPLGR